MENWQKRLVDEHKELVKRIEKLEAFLKENSPDKIQAFDYMCIQLYAMQTYAMALKARIKLYGIEGKNETP